MGTEGEVVGVREFRNEIWNGGGRGPVIDCCDAGGEDEWGVGGR